MASIQGRGMSKFGSISTDSALCSRKFGWGSPRVGPALDRSEAMPATAHRSHDLGERWLAHRNHPGALPRHAKRPRQPQPFSSAPGIALPVRGARGASSGSRQAAPARAPFWGAAGGARSRAASVRGGRCSGFGRGCVSGLVTTVFRLQVLRSLWVPCGCTSRPRDTAAWTHVAGARLVRPMWDRFARLRQVCMPCTVLGQPRWDSDSLLGTNKQLGADVPMAKSMVWRTRCLVRLAPYFGVCAPAFGN